jgi:hypothetical protein
MRNLWVHHIRQLAGGLPGIAPSDRLRFSRLQLRGSAGIAPASLSSPQGKDAQTEGRVKELEIVVRGIYRGEEVEVNCRADLVIKSVSEWPTNLQ